MTYYFGLKIYVKMNRNFKKSENKNVTILH